MPPSPLRGFNRRSIDDLADLNVHLVYDHSLIESSFYGLWYPSHDLICINPELKGIQKERVIVHEGLHAYEDLILEGENIFREQQIDWWAIYHLKKDPQLAKCMLNKLLIVPERFF